MSDGRVIIVGGGVIGAACAHYLAKAGRPVTIVDRDGFARACSHGNCGLIALSHVLPLNEPGAVGKAIKALLKPKGAFTIRPRLDLNLWHWLLCFARRCNRRDMLDSARARTELITSSGRLFEQLIEEDALACEWERRGCLFVYRDRAAMDVYAETDRLLRDEFGVGADRYDGGQLIELEPALNDGLAGAWHYPMDAHLRPDVLMASWRRLLESRGVKIVEKCSVTGFVGEKGRARGVETDQGVMEADHVVVATGAVTPFFNDHLGCRIPIQPGKGYSITMDRPAICPVIPMIFQQHKVAVTPMSSGYRLGSTMEFAGYDSSIREDRLKLLKDGAAMYLREPYTEPVIETWYGWRPMTWDGKPIIDRSPAYENVWIAAGHNMLGLTMAPATGLLVSELVTGERPHIDPAPFAVRRF